MASDSRVRSIIQSVVVTSDEPNDGITIVADRGEHPDGRYLCIEVPLSAIDGLAKALLTAAAELRENKLRSMLLTAAVAKN